MRAAARGSIRVMSCSPTWTVLEVALVARAQVTGEMGSWTSMPSDCLSSTNMAT